MSMCPEKINRPRRVGASQRVGKQGRILNKALTILKDKILQAFLVASRKAIVFFFGLLRPCARFSML